MEYEGYEYLSSVRLKDGRSWRCRHYFKSNFRCPATAKTRGNPPDIDPNHQSKPHNHEAPGPAQVHNFLSACFIVGYMKLVSYCISLI